MALPLANGTRPGMDAQVFISQWNRRRAAVPSIDAIQP
jgi:hypothetical protein